MHIFFCSYGSHFSQNFDGGVIFVSSSNRSIFRISFNERQDNFFSYQFDGITTKTLLI